jgi:hypothetical protein
MGRELAGLPQRDQILQPADQADQRGEDEGVQRRHQPGLGGGRFGRGAQVRREGGDVPGQGLLGLI